MTGSDDTPWLRLRSARHQMMQNKLRVAEASFEALLADHPDFAAARGWYGVLLCRNGHYRRAAEALEVAVSADDARLEMIHAYALSLCRLSHWTPLRALLEEHADVMRPQWAWPGGPRRFDQAFALARRQLAPERRPALGVFYHLPFCAGTSFTVRLRDQFGKSMRNVGRRQGQFDLSKLLGNGERALDKCRLVRLHYPYPLDTSRRDAVWFTLVRDPVERFMSGYRKRLDPDVLPTLDFRLEPSVDATIAHAESYGLHDMMARELAVLHPDLRREYDDWPGLVAPRMARFEEELDFVALTAELSPERLHALAAEVLEQQLGFVGIVEHFDASYLLIGALLGLHALPDPVRTGQSRERRTAPTPDQVDRIERLHEVDRALYDRWRTRFEKTFDTVIETLSSAPADAHQAS